MNQQARTTTTFEVALRGSFGPVLRAAFLAMGAQRVRTTSSFLLPARDGEGVREIVEDLGRRGMTVLDVRPAAGSTARHPGCGTGSQTWQ